LEAPPGQNGTDPLAAAGELDQRLTDRGRIGRDGLEFVGLVGEEPLELSRDPCCDGLRGVESADHGRGFRAGGRRGRGVRSGRCPVVGRRRGAVGGHGTMFPPMVTTFCSLSPASSATVTTRTLSLSLCRKLSTRALLVLTSRSEERRVGNGRGAGSWARP